MVFGLFSRKRDSTQTIEHGFHPNFPEPLHQDGPSAQLRTPSPSVNSASIDKQNSPSRDPPLTPSPPPDPFAAQNAANLRALIQSIPPQLLHTYTLAQLLPSNALSSETIAHVSSFFSELVPPPHIHCVRCHKGYFEVENSDRSCLVPHDDESAEVERVNSKSKNTHHETLWGCCGRTVEGDGDQGPPDGWCYEGKHTTDPKRARFRADSTPQDDKLISCERRRCHGPPRRIRKRGRALDDDTDNERDDDAASSASFALSASPRSSVGAKRSRPAKKSRTRLVPAGDPTDASHDEMDVDDAPSPAPAPAPTAITPSPKSKAKPPTTKSKAPPSSKKHAKAQSPSVPRTSSPLALAPPLVSRSVSPEPQSKVIIDKKLKSTVVKHKSSAASRKKAGPEQSSSKLRTSVDGPVPQPSSSNSPKPKAKRKGRTKGLEEVVESSVAAERIPAK